MIAHAYPGGPFAENAWLVVDDAGTTAVIVDPGGGTPELLDALAQSGAEPAAILLTHAHIDHVDGIALVRDRYPALPIFLHPDDRPLYDGAAQQARWFGLDLAPLPAPDQRLAAGDTLTFGGIRLEVRVAPGHAPGHVVFVAADSGFALVGDVIFQGSIGRTDLPGGDFHTLMDSIRREVLTLPDDMRLLPGHGPATTVGHERVGNPFLVPNLRGGLA